uniref:Uncharacterized protein n=1 Tax=Romanomermis culicivorax TaxID=13658 RepID=A0A915J681_ROMCU
MRIMKSRSSVVDDKRSPMYMAAAVKTPKSEMAKYLAITQKNVEFNDNTLRPNSEMQSPIVADCR